MYSKMYYYLRNNVIIKESYLLTENKNVSLQLKRPTNVISANKESDCNVRFKRGNLKWVETFNL